MKEKLFVQIIKKTVIDPSLIAIHGNISKNVTSFDVVFSKKGGTTSPDVDLVEISGINKSNFLETINYIDDVKTIVYENRRKYFINITKDLKAFEIASSFRNLLGSPQADLKTGKVLFKANAKYQSHLLKVLPLIYTNNYQKDDQLIPSFLQNVEFSVRAGNPKYSFLKFDLEFLISIQNNQTDKFMKITDSHSYQVGKKMGAMARPLKIAINSFEKNYVGLLTRRTNSLNACIEFINELDEKATMHGKTWAQNSSEARQMLSQIDSKEYNKEYLAFGFFEGYFTYEVSDDKIKLLNKLEKLVSDYSNKEDLEEILSPIITSIDNLKSLTSTQK